MKARTCRRTASSRGSNQSPPTNGDGDVAAADVASVMAWVPSRSCRTEPTPPQPFPTNLAPRPRLTDLGLAREPRVLDAQPGLELGDQGLGPLLPDRQALPGGLAVDLALDR